jgi:valyl-tRNA synthetase
VYEFLWDQFADWYIEISKTRLYEGAGGGDVKEAKAARRVLVYVLDTSLRLLHPYMPYVTEQLWHHLPRTLATEEQAAHALMLSDWPQMNDDTPLVTSDAAVSQFESFQALTRGIRNARAEYNVEPGKRISAIIVARGELLHVLEKELKSLVALARLDPDQVCIFESGSPEAKQATEVDSVQVVVQDGVEAYLPLSGLIDPEKERKRLEKRIEKLEKEIEKLSSRLNSKGFMEKAPEDLVIKVQAELAELEDQASKIEASLKALQ